MAKKILSDTLTKIILLKNMAVTHVAQDNDRKPSQEEDKYFLHPAISDFAPGQKTIPPSFLPVQGRTVPVKGAIQADLLRPHAPDTGQLSKEIQKIGR
jgi:hypothetical protein